MTPEAIIAAARAAGVELEPDGTKIRVRPSGVLSAELRGALLAAKTEVLAILRDEVLVALSEPEAEVVPACASCGSRSWAISLVDDEGGRTCIDCLSGRTALRRSGAAVPPARGDGTA